MSKETAKYLARLLKEAQKGDRRSLDTLCRELEDILRGYFWQKFGDKTIVDDLAQETYVRLLQSLPRIKEPMKLRGFVTRIAVHVSQDFLRTKYKLNEEQLEADFDSDEDSRTTKERALELSSSPEKLIENMDLREALEQLSEKSRQILMMKIDGYNYPEIAKKAGLSISGVKMQIQRSIEFLRSEIFFVTFWAFFTTILIETLGLTK